VKSLCAVCSAAPAFGLVSDGEIYLKADDSIADRFRDAGCRPVYRKGEKPVSMSYWSVPESALDDAELLKQWAELSFEVAMRGQATSRSLMPSSNRVAGPAGIHLLKNRFSRPGLCGNDPARAAIAGASRPADGR
jgi:hypothetical protein